MNPVKQYLTRPPRRSSADDIVAYVFEHPTDAERALRTMGPQDFLAAVSTIPPAVWAAYPAKGRKQQKAVTNFAMKAPNAFAVIAGWVATGASPGTPPAPTPPPVVPGSGGDPAWLAKTSGPMFFFSGPDYYFRDVPEIQIPPWLTMMRDSGVTGPDIEYQGPFPVLEYTGQNISGIDVREEYAKARAAWRKWHPQLVATGTVANLKFLNSNQSLSNDLPDDWWEAEAESFAREFGPNNMLILGLNENDSRAYENLLVPRTRSSIKSAIYRGLEAGGYPRSLLVGYSEKGPYGFVETHPKDVESCRPGDHTVLNIPDNGQHIEYLYGSNWRTGGSPITSHITRLTQQIVSLGTSGGIYSFGRVPDVTGLQAVASVLRRR